MSLHDAAEQLYGLVPEEFTDARNERARQVRAAGDRDAARQIGALRRPTTAAWLVNMLVRRHRDEVNQMLALGAEMRAAQKDLDAAQLRLLDSRRKELLSALTRQARALAEDLGHRVSDPVAIQVEQTLHAAMADAQAAAALATGMLTQPLEATGLGSVDVAGAVALPPADVGIPEPSQPRRSAEQDRDLRAARDEAQAQLQDAQETVRSLQRELRRARHRAEDERSHRQQLESDRDALQKRLRALEEDLAAATEAEHDAEGRRDSLEEREQAARSAVEQARARMDELI